MTAKLKAGSIFIDVKSKSEIHISKVDLKGVYTNKTVNPVPIVVALRSIKERTWVAK